MGFRGADLGNKNMSTSHVCGEVKAEQHGVCGAQQNSRRGKELSRERKGRSEEQHGGKEDECGS